MSLLAQLKKKKVALKSNEALVEVADGFTVVVTEMTFGEVTGMGDREDDDRAIREMLLAHSFIKSDKPSDDAKLVPAFKTIAELGELPVSVFTKLTTALTELASGNAPKADPSEGNLK